MGSAINALPTRQEKDYYQWRVMRLSLSNFTRVPNEAPSRFNVFINHIAAECEVRFTLNRLI
jgi:hypothetical protein